MIHKEYKEYASNNNTTYWCPVCNSTVRFRMRPAEFKISSEIPDCVEFDSLQVILNIKCSKCGEFMTELDNEIAQFVILLNKFDGVNTLFSCDGHVDFRYGKVQTRVPYILFQGHHLKNVIEKSIQDIKDFQLIHISNKIKIDTDFDHEAIAIYVYPNDTKVQFEDDVSYDEFRTMEVELQSARSILFTILSRLITNLQETKRDSE